MKLEKNIVKVLSLALGLAIGVVLIAKVCFELQYDSYYPHRERVYKIMTGVQRHGGEMENADQVSGAVAPGFRDFVPGVEAATRITPLFENNNYYTEDKNKLTANLLLADTSFFDIFQREIYAGDPHKVLAEFAKVMVSRSFAEKLGGAEGAVGQTIYNESLPNIKLTIDGVYEDFPQNCTFAGVDILLSMRSYSKVSTENWVGNDRYHGYVKLAEGVDPEGLEEAIHKMQEKNQPLEEFEKAGLKLWYYLQRADELHFTVKANRNMVIMLSIVALLLIAASVVNYILNAISSVVQRAKEVGVMKCYGAEGSDIFTLLFKEAAANVAAAVVVAAAIVLAFSGMIETLLGASLTSLFTPVSVLSAVAVCGVVLLVSGFIPARIFMGIPVSTAFRNYRENKRRWKLAFLVVQFSFTVFLASVLVVFGRQYDMMLNENLGYEYDNLLVVDMGGSKVDEFYKVKDGLAGIPGVVGTALVSDIPVAGSSGNNVYLPGDERELFNVADQYYSTEGSAEILGIKFLEGREATSPKEVAVSRKFVETMQGFADWSDGAIGKSIVLTEHSQTMDEIFTICGVYEDYKIGSVFVDKRPSIRFGAEQGWPEVFFSGVLVKVSSLTPDVIAQVQKVIDDLLPDKELRVVAYADGMRESFADIDKTKDSILLGGIFSLIISLIGLIGYIKDETQRRSAEMAIRKINGALPREILGIFIADVMALALVSAVIGSVAAYFTSDLVLESFVDKVPVHLWYFVAASAVVLLLVAATVAANTVALCRSNPVDSLKRGE